MLKNFLKIAPLGLVLPLMIAAASVKPEDAISNLAEWAHWFGFTVPDWLADRSTDPKVIVGSLVFAIVYPALMWGVPFFWTKAKGTREQSQTAVTDKFARDVSLLDAIWRVFLGRWGERADLPRHDYKDKRVNRFFTVCKEIRQAAFDGRLPIWAARKHSALFEPLPEFWRNREIVAHLAMIPEDQLLWINFTHALTVGDVSACHVNGMGVVHDEQRCCRPTLATEDRCPSRTRYPLAVRCLLFGFDQNDD